VLWRTLLLSHFTPEFKDSSVESFVFGELNHSDIVIKENQPYQLAEKLKADPSATTARIATKMQLPYGNLQKLNEEDESISEFLAP